MLTDQVGAYRNVDTASYRHTITTSTSDMPWRPGDNDGRAPDIFLAIFTGTGVPSGAGILVCLSADIANVLVLGLTAASSALQLYGRVRTITQVTLTTSGGITVGNPRIPRSGGSGVRAMSLDSAKARRN